MSAAPSSSSGRTRSRASTAARRPRQPLLPPPELFLPAEEFFGAIKPFRAHRHRRRGGPSGKRLPGHASRRIGDRRRCRRSQSTAAPPIRSRAAGVSSRATPARVLLLAESPGRRETMLQYLGNTASRRRPARASPNFSPATRVHAGHGAAIRRLRARRASAIAIITEAELYAGTVRAAQRARRPHDQRSRAWCATCRNSNRRPGGASPSTASAAISGWSISTSAKARPNS